MRYLPLILDETLLYRAKAHLKTDGVVRWWNECIGPTLSLMRIVLTCPHFSRVSTESFAVFGCIGKGMLVWQQSRACLIRS